MSYHGDVEDLNEGFTAFAPRPTSGPVLTLERLTKMAGAVVDAERAVLLVFDGDDALILDPSNERTTRAVSDRSESGTHPTPKTLPRRLFALEVATLGRTKTSVFSQLAPPDSNSLLAVPVNGTGDNQEQIATLVVFPKKNNRNFGHADKLEAIQEIAAIIGWTLGDVQTDIRSSHDLHGVRRSLSRLRMNDPLTGLPERHVGEAELARRVAAKSKTLVAILAIDRFGSINDSFGESVGDQVLKQSASRLSTHLDEGDFVARRGGDEFLLLLVDEPHAPAMAKLDRVRQSFIEPFYVSGGFPFSVDQRDGHLQESGALNSHSPPRTMREIHLKVSLGASPSDLSKDSAELLSFASLGLHHAKKKGGGMLELYTGELKSRAIGRFELETDLRRALAGNELFLQYQPRFSIDGAVMLGVEGLVRWRHPKDGTIPPGKFIPLAEETGWILHLGKWCLNEACRQRRLWLDAGIDVGRVSVNVSAVQFARKDFVSTVVEALKAHSLSPEYIELEVTETCLMSELDLAAKHLGELRKLGAAVSVDDFGTGYSSLAYLQKLPVDTLKIDRSFVKDLDEGGVGGQAAHALAEAITYLGHRLGLKVLAEGVETEPQRAILSSLGCDEVQGFLLARPLDPSAVTALVLARVKAASGAIG